MFTDLDKVFFIDNIKERAKNQILIDRLHFKKIYNVVDEYCRDHHEMFISNIQKILNQEPPLNIVYDIYCENPYKHAVLLSDKIFLNVGKWIQMKTKIPHKEFVISYDSRNLIFIFGMDIHKFINTNILVNPILINNINYMPPELEIIDIYKKLYSPNDVDEWVDSLMIEKKLFKLIYNRIEKTGGWDCKPCKRRRSFDIEIIKIILFGEYIPTKNYVLIGHWGMSTIKSTVLKKNIEPHVEKLQVLSPYSIEKDVECIKQVISNYTKYQLIYKEHEMNLPKDFRIKRYTLYIKFPYDGGFKEKPFMDIFNSPQFQLIPYKELQIEFEDKCVHIKIGNPFVLLRFVMIDLWIIKIIKQLKKMSTEILINKTKSLIELYNDIKNPKYKWIDNVFGIDYIGINIDYSIAKTKETLKYRYLPYLPALALKQDKFGTIY